jgi:hypothetical protein
VGVLPNGGDLLSYQPNHRGGGRPAKPIDPRIIDALERTREQGCQAEIPLIEADQTGDISDIINEIRRAGQHHFPGLSTRVKRPRGKVGKLLFWLTEKNPRLARNRPQDGTT